RRPAPRTAADPRSRLLLLRPQAVHVGPVSRIERLGNRRSTNSLRVLRPAARHYRARRRGAATERVIAASESGGMGSLPMQMDKRSQESLSQEEIWPYESTTALQRNLAKAQPLLA